MSEFKYSLGCAPSVLDGTEHKVTADEKISLPTEFSWQAVMPPVRDQGSTSTCVCQSLTGVLDFYHNTKNGVSGICNNYSIDELYSIRANKRVEGMTFKEALHYLRHNGLSGEKINSYAMIGSSEIAKYALVTFGPIVCGLPVYTSDINHFWRKSGRYEGGHAVTLVGYDTNGFILRNSWGTSWGNNGHIDLSYNDYNTYCFEAWTATL